MLDAKVFCLIQTLLAKSVRKMFRTKAAISQKHVQDFIKMNKAENCKKKYTKCENKYELLHFKHMLMGSFSPSRINSSIWLS